MHNHHGLLVTTPLRASEKTSFSRVISLHGFGTSSHVFELEMFLLKFSQVFKIMKF